MMTKQDTSELDQKQRRAPWRQRLINAESGFREGVRADSSLWAFFLFGGCVLLAAVVFQLSRVEISILILSLALVFTTELMVQILRLMRTRVPEIPEAVIQIGTCVVVVAQIACVAIAGTLMWPHFSSIWN